MSERTISDRINESEDEIAALAHPEVEFAVPQAENDELIEE
jgi:hypothetical protein